MMRTIVRSLGEAGRRASARVLTSDRGASLVEYALLLALIALICFAAVGFLGGRTSGGLSEFNSSFQNAGS